MYLLKGAPYPRLLEEGRLREPNLRAPKNVRSPAHGIIVDIAREVRNIYHESQLSLLVLSISFTLGALRSLMAILVCKQTHPLALRRRTRLTPLCHLIVVVPT